MHNSHPHGQTVVQPHELKDHIMEQARGGNVGLNKVAKLPDQHREDHEMHPYPNEFQPVPTQHRGAPHQKRVEPDAFGGNKDRE